jgi:hypothetical protein
MAYEFGLPLVRTAITLLFIGMTILRWWDVGTAITLPLSA